MYKRFYFIVILLLSFISPALSQEKPLEPESPIEKVEKKEEKTPPDDSVSNTKKSKDRTDDKENGNTGTGGNSGGGSGSGGNGGGVDTGGGSVIPAFNSAGIEVEPRTGSTNFSVPIEVPPGRMGIQPSLSLIYSSSIRNGLIGGGWTIELGNIHRSTKKGFPQYNATDTFVLESGGGGQEDLVLDPATGYYRPKKEGAFVKIEFINNSYWVVTDKKGTKYFYGRSVDTQQVSGARVFKWCLDKVEDIHTNYLSMEYEKQGIQIYPLNIHYTANAQYGMPWHAKVNLEWGARVGLGHRSWMSGMDVLTRKKLTNIRVYVKDGINQILQRRYELRYPSAPTTQPDLVKEIVQYGADDTTSLPPIKFSYSQWVENFEPRNINNFPAYNLGSGDVRVFDMTGDGKADVISRNQATGVGFLVYENTSQEHVINFASPHGVTNSETIPFSSPEYLRYVDFNGDGLVDVLYGNGAPWKVWINRGDGGFYPERQFSRQPTRNIANSQVQLADMNSDGLVDVVESVDGAYEYYLNINGPNLDQPRLAVNSPAWSTGHPDVRMADMNGDGLVDVIYGTLNTYTVWINNGVNGFHPPRNLTNFPHTALQNGDVTFVDMNGDGLSDILRTYGGEYQPWEVYHNDGRGDFTPVVSLTNAPPYNAPRYGMDNTNIKFTDINDDGFMDVLYAVIATGGGPNWYLHMNNGMNGFNPAVPFHDAPLVNSGYQHVLITDLNGDNLPEFFYGVTNDTFKVWVNNRYAINPRSDDLMKVENSMGAETQLQYGHQFIRGVLGYQYKDIAYNNYLFPIVKSITRRVAKNGVANNWESFTTQYMYQNGLWNHPNREFRGFQYTRLTDVNGNYTQTEFLQDDIFNGMVKSQVTRGLVGNSMVEFSKSVNQWVNHSISGGANFVYLRRVDNLVKDGNSSARCTAQEFEYNESVQYGNLTRTVQLGEVACDENGNGADIGTDRRSIETQYISNTSSGNYIVGLPYQTVVKDHNANEVRKSWFYYDLHLGLLDPPIRGQLSKKENWVDTSAANISTRYTYDRYGNLDSTTDARNTTTTIVYDYALGMFPLSTTAANQTALSQTVVNQYFGVNAVALDDGNGYRGLWGQSKSVQDANNQVARKSHDTFGREMVSVSPLDTRANPTAEASYEFFPTYVKVSSRQRIEHNQSAVIESVSFYDGFGRLIQSKSPSEVAGRYIVSGQVEYNTRGLPEKQYGSFFSTNPVDFIEPINTSRPHTTVSYDAVGRVIRSTNPDGTYSSVSYDDWMTETINENGHKQKSYADAYGRLIKKEEYLGADGRGGASIYPQTAFTLYATTEYTYDSEGNLVQTRDAHNNLTTILYDRLGRKKEMTDADMGRWQYGYDANGNLSWQIDAKNQRIEFDYDVLNRLTAKRFPASNQSTVNYTYDEVTVNYSKGRLTKAQYAGADNTRFRYDPLGREISSQKYINQTPYDVARTYDALNRLKNVQYPDATAAYYTYNSGGQIETVADAPHVAPQQMLPPVTHYKLNDNAVNPTIIDSGTGANNGTASTNTNSLSQPGKINQSLQFNGTNQCVNIDNVLNTVRNDTVGSLSLWVRRESDAPGTVFSFGSTANNSIFSLTVHSNGQIMLGFYDGVGSTWGTLPIYTDFFPRSVWTHVAIVQDGVEPILYKNGVRQTISFYIDNNRAGWFNNFSSGWAAFNNGRLGCASAAGSGNASWFNGAVDDFRYYGRTLSQAEVAALYNAGLGTEEDPVIQPGSNPNFYVANVDYNEHGQIIKIDYANGTTTTYDYNPVNLRLRRLLTYYLSPTTKRQDFTYIYDNVGNIIAIADGVNTATQTFYYDELNRLTQAQGQRYGIKTFAYDEIGNIIQKDTKTYTYGQNPGCPSVGAQTCPHAVTSLSDGTQFRYDANGNMIWKMESGNLTEYFYDIENRLAEVKKNGIAIALYEYDGDGGRTKKIVYNNLAADCDNCVVTTKYVGSLFEEEAQGPGPAPSPRSTKFIFLGGTRVASVTGNRVMYYHDDHLGGTNVLTDATGTVKEITEYLPFGAISGRDRYGSSEEVARYYFTGKPYDDETGLIYFGARYYDPSLGRFITPDSVVQDPYDPQTLNRYSYAGNNPVNNIDPTGHFWKKFWKKWGGLFGVSGAILKGVFAGDWSTLQRMGTAAASAALFSWGNPYAIAASVVAAGFLDTESGQQFTKFLSNSVFDDAFGASPRVANILGNVVSTAIVTSAVYIAITPETYTGPDFRDPKNQTDKIKQYKANVKTNGGTGTNEMANGTGKSQWLKQGRISSQNGWADNPVIGRITKALGVNHTATVVQTPNGFFDSALDSNLINPLSQGDLWAAPWTGTCQQVAFTTLVEKGGASAWQAFTAVGQSSGWTYYATSAIYGVRADFGGVGLIQGTTNQYYKKE